MQQWPVRGSKEEALGRAAEKACNRGDFQLAIKLYKEAGSTGKNSTWYSAIGNIYDDNLDPPSPDKAVHYYKLGARIDPSAAYNLAVHYFWKGNERWHRYWLDRAVELGNAEAHSEFEEWKATSKSARRLLRQTADRRKS